MVATLTMRNLEAKFRLGDLAEARRRALAIGFDFRATLRQHDTFFNVAHGKLKLREESAGGCLIYYRRAVALGCDPSEIVADRKLLSPDQIIYPAPGALALSNYEIVPVADPAATRAMLAAALGILSEVRKERTLLIRRNVRLHLDRVDGLGDFGEIESVLAEGITPESNRAEVGEILAALAIRPDDLFGVSYFELARRAS